VPFRVVDGVDEAGGRLCPGCYGSRHAEHGNCPCDGGSAVGELAAFFGCPYYAALRLEKAIPLRCDSLYPARSRPRDDHPHRSPSTHGHRLDQRRDAHEARDLKHRPTASAVPRRARRMQSESVHLHCADRQDAVVSQRIENALDADTGITHSLRCETTSGYAHRRHQPDLVPYTSVNLRRRPTPGPRTPASEDRDRGRRPPRNKAVSAAQMSSCGPASGDCGQPDPAHACSRTTINGRMNHSLTRGKPVKQSHVTGYDQWKRVAGDGFEPSSAEPTVLQP
jgi:hypothetical protein